MTAKEAGKITSKKLFEELKDNKDVKTILSNILKIAKEGGTKYRFHNSKYDIFKVNLIGMFDFQNISVDAEAEYFRGLGYKVQSGGTEEGVLDLTYCISWAEDVVVIEEKQLIMPFISSPHIKSNSLTYNYIDSITADTNTLNKETNKL